MAIIYSYPVATPELQDLLLGTEIIAAGEDSPRTRTFTIDSIVNLANSSVLPLLALKANIASPTFTGTVSGITKTMVGLSNVDDTSDLSKPISTATQNALNLKAPLASPAFIGTVTGIDKTMVGLSNVDNTSDAAKPVSTATQTALNLKVTANTLITGATFPKITYDTKGLVTSGSALIATDIPTILQSQVSNLGTDLGNLAPKASPTFTGIPLSTTAAIDTNTTQIATTAYVVNQGYAKLSGASFTGAVSSTGSVTGNTVVKSGGTVNQYLMANGAVSTDSQVLYKAASTTYQTAGSQVALQTSVFPISILTTGTLLKINSLTTTLATSVGTISTSYFISQLPGDTVTSGSCFQIATYNATFGNLYYPMDRVLWSNGTNLYVRNSTGSTNTSSGTANSIETIPIASINNGGIFYITVLLGTTSTDRSCLSYIQVST